MRADAGCPRPAHPVPRHSPPASRRAADCEEGTGAWPCVDGGCVVTSIWDEIFFTAAQGEMASYIPCTALESTLG